MFERKLVSQLVDRINEPRKFIQIVTGPRQTGKTTAVLQALKKINLPRYYVNADDPALVSENWLRHEWKLARILAKTGGAILIIDEIQNVSRWSSLVKLLWDDDTLLQIPLKVIIIGPSALLLQRGLTESLMGRFEVLHCLHWNYSECKEAFGYTIDDFLFFGGYPGAAKLINEDDRWTEYMGSSIVDPAISHDILMMEKVRKPALLRSLFLYGCMHSAQQMSYVKIPEQLLVTDNTVTIKYYLNLLEKAGMLAGLQNYSVNQIRIIQNSLRFIVYDTSLMTYAFDVNKQRFLDNAGDYSRLVQSAVGANLLVRGKAEGFEVYWCHECDTVADFIIKSGRHLTSVEVNTGRVKSSNDSVVLKKLNPDAPPFSIGSDITTLEDFFLGKTPLFL